MKIDEENLSTLCLCSERYALGRRTYIVSMVCGIIKQLKRDITDNTLRVIIKDIANPLFGGVEDYSPYGDDCDKADWMDLLSELKEEAERRGLDAAN